MDSLYNNYHPPHFFYYYIYTKKKWLKKYTLGLKVVLFWLANVYSDDVDYQYSYRPDFIMTFILNVCHEIWYA